MLNIWRGASPIFLNISDAVSLLTIISVSHKPLNLIYGIAAIANSHVFTANAHYVFANLRTSGLLT